MTTHLAVFAARDENVHAVNLVLSKGGSLEVLLLPFRGVEDDALLAIVDVLRLLARQHSYAPSVNIPNESFQHA